MISPIRTNTCTGATRNARWTTSRWKVSWYCSEASEAKPAIPAARNGRARKIRRSTPIFHTIRHASPKDGGGSRVSGASSAPVPARAVSPVPAGPVVWSGSGRAASSKRPRGGSRSRRPTSTTTAIGMANTTNGTRQLPNAVVSPAPISTPLTIPSESPARCTE